MRSDRERMEKSLVVYGMRFQTILSPGETQHPQQRFSNVRDIGRLSPSMRFDVGEKEAERPILENVV